ncbi:MAG: DUF2905 domain-containing protein [Saprospiraceae bacterium]|nr:DUF2905 domain-containing protein [Candidatus Vicinibacter affinis]
MNPELAKWLAITGILLLLAALLVYFFGPYLKWIGHLPGDIYIKKEGFSFYFPITTMVLFSILVNLIIRLVRFVIQ